MNTPALPWGKPLLWNWATHTAASERRYDPKK